MNDLAGGFAAPCLADFKVGTRNWDVNCAEPFKSRLIAKNEISTSISIGLRLVSMTLYSRKRLKENTSKSENLSLLEEKLQEKILRFIPNDLLLAFNEMLIGLKAAFMEVLELYPGFRMYSVSILLAYDADNLQTPPRLALVDLAHAHFDIASAGGDLTDKAFDDGVLLGINTFIRMTSQI
jgi:hypothetical protein